MASLWQENDRGRKGWRIRVKVGEKKKSIWLGEMPKGAAFTSKEHIEHLAYCANNAKLPHSQSLEWLASLPEGQYVKLVNAGLVEPRQNVNENEIPTLKHFIAGYIASCLNIKERTRNKYEQVEDNLLTFFGADRRIDSITSVDAEAFREWLKSDGNRREGKVRKGHDGKAYRPKTTLADNTVRRRTGLAKQFFQRAVKAKQISENPFDGLPCSVRANEARQQFIPQDVIADLINNHCPNAEWRAILALARFGGLRCPSEPMELRWRDIDLINRRLRIFSPKTEHHTTGGIRYCPIFPELLPYLEDLAELAKAKGAKPSDRVFQDTRGSEAFYRTGLMKILKKAGVMPWPKLFQNLRASRETELLALHPIKDVCSWIGNTQAVAMKHYAMVMDSSFAKAAGLGGAFGGAENQDKKEAEAATGNNKRTSRAKKPQKNKENSLIEQLKATLGNHWQAAIQKLIAEAGLEPARGLTLPGF